MIRFAGLVGATASGNDGDTNGDTGTARSGGSIDAHTLTTSVGVSTHSVTNGSVNNEPAYAEVIWLIRVK